jgi:hypothetical protein
MRLYRPIAIVSLSMALAAVTVLAAHAQDSASTRGSTKVRSRVFNPFNVQGSRLSINPFGAINVAASGSAAGSAAVADPGDGGSTPDLAIVAVRPPFRPPVRSPFRPPPRPPFFPP